MSDEPETQRLQDLIPQNLDDIIRANRDKCRLAFATDEECHELERDLTNAAAGKVCHTLKDWNLLMIHITANGSVKSLPKLLGGVQETGQCWITSTVKGIDTHTGLVLTENSLYRVVGRKRQPLLIRHQQFGGEGVTGDFVQVPLGIPSTRYACLASIVPRRDSRLASTAKRAWQTLPMTARWESSRASWIDMVVLSARCW